MRRNQGFTVVELLVALILVFIIAILVVLQKSDIDASHRDQQRKSNVNAMYYALKEGYYPKNQSYPTEANQKTLPYIDPAAFKQVGDSEYKIVYKGLNCDNQACQKFSISVRLEKEETYKKSSQ